MAMKRGMTEGALTLSSSRENSSSHWRGWEVLQIQETESFGIVSMAGLCIHGLVQDCKQATKMKEGLQVNTAGLDQVHFRPKVDWGWYIKGPAIFKLRTWLNKIHCTRVFPIQGWLRNESTMPGLSLWFHGISVFWLWWETTKLVFLPNGILNFILLKMWLMYSSKQFSTGRRNSSHSYTMFLSL